MFKVDFKNLFKKLSNINNIRKPRKKGFGTIERTQATVTAVIATASNKLVKTIVRSK